MFWEQVPQWTPDGSSVVFAAYAVEPDRSHRIYISADSYLRALQVITEREDDSRFDINVAPVISPDGSKVVYATLKYSTGIYPAVHSWEIAVADLETKRKKRLTSNEFVDGNPAWSSDGSTIAFSTDREGPYYIYTMSADGKDPEPVVMASRYADPFRAPVVWWSPDDSRIALLVFERSYLNPPHPEKSDKHGEWTRLYTVRRDGTELVDMGDIDECAPAWSPDGRRIAFARRVASQDGEDHQHYLVTADADGSNMDLRKLRWPANSISWSADGSEIYYGSGQKLYAIAPGAGVTGADAREIGQLPKIKKLILSWSPDGSRMAYSTSDGVTTVAPDGSVVCYLGVIGVAGK